MLSFFTTERPLQSIVSMGLHHPIPYREVYQRDRYPLLELIQWVYQMERDRKVRSADITIPPRPKVQYCTQSWKTHISPITHTVIYCSNKSLVPPNFLWISISPWTYLHWSTSSVRMCQASLTVTLKNDSQISAICVCFHLSVYVCRVTKVGFVQMQHFWWALLSPSRLYDTNPW